MAKHKLQPPLLYGISNRKLHPELSIDRYLAALFQSRADIVQWREKDLLPETQQKAVLEGVRLAQDSGKIFLVNSDIRLALESGAEGAHLTSNQSVEESLELRRVAGRGENFLLGKSVHSVPEALQAEAEGVDYLLLSPIFDPISKQSERMPLGMSGLREATHMLFTPVFALGGISQEKIPHVYATSAVGIAGISWLSEEIRAQT